MKLLTFRYTDSFTENFMYYLGIKIHIRLIHGENMKNMKIIFQQLVPGLVWYALVTNKELKIFPD